MKLKKIATTALAALMVATTLGAAAVPSSALWTNYPKYKGFDGKNKRFCGINRMKTSQYVASTLNAHNTSETVHDAVEGQGTPIVFVNENSFKDGLTAYNLCKAYNAKLILTPKDYVNVGLINNTYKANTVYLLGSTNELHKNMDAFIKTYSKRNHGRNVKVIRIGDADPYARNKKVLQMTGFSNVGVADGRKFPDALSAAGLLNEKGYGLMLVNGAEDYAVPAGVNVKYTLGGPNSVKKQMGERIAGNDRYETAKAINQQASNYKNILFVDGKNFPDSISAINLVKPRNSIVVPIANGRNNSYAEEFLKKLPAAKDSAYDTIEQGYAIFIGGPGSISQRTIQNMLYPVTPNPMSDSKCNELDRKVIDEGRRHFDQSVITRGSNAVRNYNGR